MKLPGNLCLILIGLLLVLELTNASAVVRRKRSPRFRRSDSSEEAGGGGGMTGGGGATGGNGGGADGSDSGGNILDKLKTILGKLPIIGGIFAEAIQKLNDGWRKGQDLTNGGIGRIFGGAFPCTLDLDSFRCTGVSTTSDMSELVGTLLKPVPGIVIPGPLKDLIVWALGFAWAPTMDLLFGGVKP